MTDTERRFVDQLTETLARAADLLTEARALGVEWDELDGDTCDDHGNTLCRLCAEHWARQTCHHPDHDDRCVLDEMGAA